MRVVVWQKPTQCFKAIFLQLKNKLKKEIYLGKFGKRKIKTQ